MSKARDLADFSSVAPDIGRRNIAYNGAMNVWQRGTSADSASNANYMCDRWLVSHSSLDGNVDWDQETSSTPDGFGYAVKVSTDASEASLDAADTLFIRQKFEGQDLQSLKKGTSGAESLTLSFWVKSSVASTYTAALFDRDNNRTIGKSYVINTADTWEFKTVTFEGDTTGTLDNNNGDSFRLDFWIDAGSDYTSGTFSTAWQTTDTDERVYDTTGWLESSSPEFYLTGVQLEVGTVATPFEHRSYGEELALCQRYYLRYDEGTGATATNTRIPSMFLNETTSRALTMFAPSVEFRAKPAASVSNVSHFNLISAGSSTETATLFGLGSAANNKSVYYFFDHGGTFTAGNATQLIVNTTAGGYLEFDAEL